MAQMERPGSNSMPKSLCSATDGTDCNADFRDIYDVVHAGTGKYDMSQGALRYYQSMDSSVSGLTPEQRVKCGMLADHFQLIAGLDGLDRGISREDLHTLVDFLGASYRNSHSLAEAKKYGEQHFDAIDTSGDGLLSSDELQDFGKKHPEGSDMTSVLSSNVILDSLLVPGPDGERRPQLGISRDSLARMSAEFLDNRYANGLFQKADYARARYEGGTTLGAIENFVRATAQWLGPVIPGMQPLTMANRIVSLEARQRKVDELFTLRGD